MKLLLTPKPTGPRAQRAFTLVEIVLSLAIIAIALVAIIGVMPIGLNVQAENQEESVISADAAIWMEAFRNGAQGMEYLVRDDVNGNEFYIKEVVVKQVLRERDPSGLLYRDDPISPSLPPSTNYSFSSASNLLGILSLPSYPQNYVSLTNGASYTNWNVYADVRALNGNMADLAADMDFAFKYRMTPELVPIQGLRPLHLSTTNGPLWIMETNLFELRLNFQWPIVPGKTNFLKSLNFRTLISGQQFIRTNEATGDLLYFMSPRHYSYLTNTPPTP